MGNSPPVLDGLSESELDAIVSQLRTDKNLTVAPVPAATERLGAVTEQRLRLTSSGRLSFPESEAAREEAALQAWHIALGERVTGPLQSPRCAPTGSAASWAPTRSAGARASRAGSACARSPGWRSPRPADGHGALLAGGAGA